VKKSQKCVDCGKKFSYEVKRGRQPVRCVKCRAALKAPATPTEITKQCTVCEQDFTYTRKKGKPPVKCEACRTAPAVQRPSSIKIKCVDCQDTFIYERKRGKQPIRCPECRTKKLTRTLVELTITCRDCNKDFVWERKGRQPVRCPECRAVDPTGQKAKEQKIARIHFVPEQIEIAFRKEVDALVAEYGGPKHDIWLVPVALMHEAQANLRKAWCEAYGKNVDLAAPKVEQ
jgi:DNA-directed RNA polymerase subunit RPC12/RpoP